MITQTPQSAPALRVVILTASIGAGHLGPANELARRLTDAGHAAEILDLVEVAPLRIGRAFRSLFHAQLNWVPGSWGALFTNLQQADALPWIARQLVATVWRRVNRILSGDAVIRPADVVVGTFPLAGHVLAAGRREGPTVPAVVYVTDPAVHRLWIAEGTDLYLTTWDGGADQVGCHTSARATDVAPAIRPEFRVSAGPGDRPRSRLALGLPAGPLALLCSGSWGVGDVERAAIDLLATCGMTPVVVCGRNDRLLKRLAGTPGIVTLGWVEDMAALMRCCDVAVLNSGGLTLAECVASGLPVVHYLPLPGQGAANASFCERTGQAGWPRTAGELAAAITLARTDSHSRLPVADPIDEILAMARHSPPRPWPSQRWPSRRRPSQCSPSQRDGVA
ncbi:glycosyltransferase [Nakamurella lactea]|uniref:glycosyltransferase n=1 Tax=Nakamurella lactea TaxID=459515 RepID=UPI0004049368|nr:glycosyltransferase [Nakamurella lactea]